MTQHHHAAHTPGYQGPRKRLRRLHKNLIHGSLLIAIAASLYFDGAKLADGLFFALSVVTEVI